MKTINKIIIITVFLQAYNCFAQFGALPEIYYDNELLLNTQCTANFELNINNRRGLLLSVGATSFYPIGTDLFIPGIEGAIEYRIYILNLHKNDYLFAGIYLGSGYIHTPDPWHIMSAGYSYGFKLGYKIFLFEMKPIFNPKFILEPYAGFSASEYSAYFGVGSMVFSKAIGLRFGIEWSKTKIGASTIDVKEEK